MTRHEESDACRKARMLAQADQVGTGTRSAMSGMALYAILLVPEVGWAPYLTWAAVMVVSYALRDAWVRRIVRLGDFSRRSEMWLGNASVPLGIVVNFPAFLFFPMLQMETRSLYGGALLGWMIVGVTILGLNPRSYALYTGMSAGLQLIGWATVVPMRGLPSVVIMLGASAYLMVRLSRQLTRTFNESFWIRYENEALVARLTQAISERDAAQMTRSRFLAAASHDLLQPVHALLLLVGVLRDGARDEVRKQAVERITVTAGVIDAMFRGLLDQARLEAGVVAPRLASVQMEVVCRAIEAAYAPRCQRKGLKFTVECPAGLRVHADAALLDRALRNLVDNAVKFTSKGGVSLKCTDEGAKVSIQVEDDGPGIPDEEREKIFGAFFRGSAPAVAGVEGVGLGLSVTRQMVLLMGGDVSLAQGRSSGTCFTVALPLAQTESGHEEVEAGNSEGRVGRLKYQKVLVVEDDPQVLSAMSLWLELHGSEALTAACLDEAVRKLSGTAWTPECVISDYYLKPGPNGLKVIEAMRARYGPIAAILVTGERSDSLDVPEGIPVLLKPLSPQVLQAVLAAPKEMQA